MYLVLNRNDLLVGRQEVYLCYLKNIKTVLFLFKDTCKKKKIKFVNKTTYLYSRYNIYANG